LAAALQAKTEAELGRTEAEQAAQKARTDVVIARKEFEDARNDANAAKEEIDRLKAGADTPESYGKVAVLIGICAAAVVFLIILIFSRMQKLSPRASVDVGRADTELDGQDGAPGEVTTLSAASESAAEAEPSVAQDGLVEQLAKTLGVHVPVAPLSAETPVDANSDQLTVEQRERAHASTSGEKGEKPPNEPARLSSREDGPGASRSSILAFPNVSEAKEVKPA
jgi:hypothetical protein